MSLRTDTFELGGLHLAAGEARHLDLIAGIDPFEIGGQEYRVEPDAVPVRLDISRTTGPGYALRLRFEAALAGPCMRCLEPASPRFQIDAREISQPGGGEELSSPYMEDEMLDLRGWVRDSLALVLPATLLCQSDCAGLCAICGENLNAVPPGHAHERTPDPRWAKLSELRFD